MEAQELRATDSIVWADELRLGLISQVRRRWCSIGVELVQPTQISYQYCYLYLAVDVRTGQLYWQWHPNMKRESMAQAVHAWHAAGVDAIVWDGAPGHRAQELQRLGPTLINQPPYAPELNPVERFFQLLRQEVEGEVYATLQDKQNAVEQLLLSLARTPQTVRSLTGYPWIRTALDTLPIISAS